jgi:quercetin dioxygenase-like cupin family protein
MNDVTRFAAAAASVVLLGSALVLLPATASAQDAAKADAKHYKVEFENDQVRVLRIHYGPHEKGNMHSHPAGVVVYLTDTKGKFTFPDGKTMDSGAKAGTVVWTDATTHQPENTGDQPFDVIQIEMKQKPAAKK